uniref:Uncharacterized protein C6orf132 homolog n=1 Tax=Pogona vitticeps TaxID=103695 RepID=A0A6J0SIW7_9SAUR
MKKHNSVQGTFSRLFGKKHASNNSANNLFVTNPPWIFTQEVKSDTLASSGELDGIYYGDNRFGSVTDSGTATLKPRPRVRPLLTFLPLNAQETHGVAVPTPSVPEGFEDKLSPGLGSQIGGNYRKYNSVVDLRPKAFEENYLDDDYIPPPPSVPPPPPPPSTDLSPPPYSMEVPPSPPMLPPPPPPPPAMPAPSLPSLVPPSDPYSNLSSPSTPSPPDFIPPTPPLAFTDGAGHPLPHIPPFSNGVSKWKSETVLNLREPGSIPHSPNLISPITPTQKKSQFTKSDQDPHLTFPRSLKIPPPTPVRTSSISSAEKESSPKDEQLPTMVPHSRPALPPNFTIRSATAVHTGGESGRKATLEKPSIVVTESGNSSLTSDSNGSLTQMKHEITSRGKTEPSAEHASSNDDDDDEWNERSNLDKLKHELSALLSSSCRKEDKIIVPKTKTNITDTNHVATDELKQAKPVVKSSQSSPPVEGEKKEKIAAKISSPSKVITSDAISTPDTMTVQANSVMKFKDELEAVLSPTKDGGPPLAFANLRHNPETKKQVTLQFGGGQINGEASRLPKPIAHQNNSTLEGTEKDPKASPSASSNHTPSYKPPVSPQKPKNEPLVPAASSPASSGTASPIRTASPSMDFSLLQYKTHRMQLGSVDSLASATSSQTTEDGSVSINNPENQKDSGERKLSVASSLSSNMEQTNNEVLIHPVTGEKVERGSPMALLLAAQQRAQRGRSSASASRQNSYLSEKPPIRLSENLHNSNRSETGMSTIYYNDAKPNSVTVVPKLPQKGSLVLSEQRQPTAASASNSSDVGLSEFGQKEQKPQTLSNAPEENKNGQKLPETNEKTVSINRYNSSSLVQSLLASSHSKQQDLHNMPEAPANSLTTAQNHTASNNEEEEDVFDYEIIPPPPEFSNDASGVPLSSSNREQNHISSNSLASDKQLNLSHSGYDSSQSYSLTSKPTLENNTRPSGYTHHYPGGSYSSSYLSSYSSTRPLIKKRLYVSETDGSYGRAAMYSRSVSSPNSYGHNTLTYHSQAAEGKRRVNSIQRNVPNSAQGRRVSLELPGKTVAFNVSSDAKYKGQNGEYSSAPAAGRSSQGSLSYGGTANTFTVRPGTRQPISYSYQGGLH